MSGWVGRVHLTIGSTGAENFDDVLQNPNRSATVTSGQLLLSLEAGAEYRIFGDREGGGLQVGLRAGYLWAPSQAEWELGDTGGRMGRTPRWAARSRGFTSAAGATSGSQPRRGRTVGAFHSSFGMSSVPAMRSRVLLVVLLVVVGGGAAASAQPADTSAAMETTRRPIPYPITPDRAFQQAVEAGTRTTTGTPGPDYWTNTTSYDLQATVDPSANVLRGSGTIRYQNRSPDTLRRLVLHLRQNIHKRGALRNRPAEVTGGMVLDRLSLGGVDSLRRVQSRQQLQRRGQGYVVQDTRLVVFPPEPVAPDSSITLTVEWHFDIPGADNFRMGQDGEVYYLGYWYPQMAVYDDVHGWTAEPYQGDGEFYMGFADYDVSVTVPEGWLVGATGTLQNGDAVLSDSVQARLDRARTAEDIISVVDSTERGVGTATAAAPDGDSTLTWRFAAEQVRDVAFGASRHFVWDATSAATGASRRMIHAFYRPEKRLWRRSAEFGQFSVEHLSDTIMPYPDPQMTTVEGPIGGGMEYPMITLIGDPPTAEALFGVTYHEISHMWFPMTVGTNEKKYAWLDEGTTTFNETEGRDAFYPDQDAWARSEHYYFRFASSVETPSMRHADRYPVDGPARYVASYDKPGVMLHALRGILGDEVFRKAYRAYAERWAYKHPTPYDFFNTFEDVVGRELDWFWRGAFYESWTMDHAIQSVDPRGDSTVVTVADEGLLPMPVILEATYADGRTVERRVGVDPWLAGRRQVTVVLEGNAVSRVVLNPNGVLPDLTPANNRWTASATERESAP